MIGCKPSPELTVRHPLLRLCQGLVTIVSGTCDTTLLIRGDQAWAADVTVSGSYARERMMQIEDYFEVLAPNVIRLRGHRISIESILDEYVHGALSAEEIQAQFPTLSLEQIYATILYYLQNRQELDRYLTAWIDLGEQMLADQRRNPSPAVARLMAHQRDRKPAANPAG